MMHLLAAAASLLRTEDTLTHCFCTRSVLAAENETTSDRRYFSDLS